MDIRKIILRYTQILSETGFDSGEDLELRMGQRL
jgi:hypothetical protein